MTAVITITNASDATIFATVESARTIIATESQHEKQLRQTAAGGGVTLGAKGASVGANGHNSTTAEDVTTIARTYSVKHGPNAGFTAIRSGATGELSVHDTADQYFLTLSDGTHVIAYRASLDATEHDYIRLAGSGKTLHFDATPDAPAIQSGDAISLKSGSRFVGMPSQAKNWPAGVLSSAAGAHTILDFSTGLVGPVKSGDVVKLKGIVLGDDRDHCFMYSSDKGWIYYDRASSNEKQLWIISKVGGAKGPIRAGDSVLFHNYYWRTAQLRPGPVGNWLACDDGKDAPFVIDLM
jgi:hypothetical protein